MAWVLSVDGIADDIGNNNHSRLLLSLSLSKHVVVGHFFRAIEDETPQMKRLRSSGEHN
jgi:hypothetical protein